MSVIKLRFWCDTHGYITCGFGEPIESISFNQRGEVGLLCPLCHKARPMKVERWTGVVDRKGVDIYENDIVRCKQKDSKDKRRWKLVFVSKVFWDYCGWTVTESPTCDDSLSPYSGDPNQIAPIATIEVIGNARENSNLLMV